MGYEIWDRDAAALVADFDDQDRALDFLREMVRGLDTGAAVRRVDRLQLVRVTNAGRMQEVVADGVDLLSLIFAPAVAR